MAALLFGVSAHAHAGQALPVYFDLGPKLVQEFQGTYVFKNLKRQFVRTGASSYSIQESGDQSPSTANLSVKAGQVVWVVAGSGEQWLKFNTTLSKGASWNHELRGWRQRYEVEDTDAVVTVPAGLFKHCAKVTISWVAHEHDMEGPQRVVLYLAPHMGIIRREDWSDGEKFHEEVLMKYSSRLNG